MRIELVTPKVWEEHWVVEAHVFNPSSQETEAGGSL